MSFFDRVFKKNKLASPVDLSSLKTDMHSHLIPGIDDGVADMETALLLLKKLAGLGYKKVITTPHVMFDLYRNTHETIKEGEAKTKEAIKQAGLKLEFEAAAEYLIDDGFGKLLEENNFLTFGNNHLLVELPYNSKPNKLGHTLFELQTRGYNVILAHPERYSYWYNNWEVLENMKEAGILFQVNINSLTRFHSLGVVNAAKKLINASMVDFLGTDLHNEAYFSALEMALKEPLLLKLIESGNLKNQEL